MKLLQFAPREVNLAKPPARLGLPESFEPSQEYALLVLSILPIDQQEAIYRILAELFAKCVTEPDPDTSIRQQ
ncbi:hypothetical protein [Acidobacterium sp. S8]|uniref:hypothetical protein n=1 Tax=Acidobacterium sp. S8 TaxID=1641854 RepID=UPI00131BFB4C|nr:hypothetical protein [Acidobacterium sp. S8]